MSPRKSKQFNRALKSRKRDFSSNRVEKKVTQRVINCFNDGKSLKNEITLPFPLELFLTKLQTTENAFEQAIEYLDDIKDSRKWFFIVGDYGCGKTQLKFRIQATAEAQSRGFMVIVSANMQETSLKGFCSSFITKLKQLISRDHKEIFPQFQFLFEEYHRKMSTRDNIRIMTQLIKIGVNNDLSFLFQFDEIDQIDDSKVFQPWGSLLVSLNDQIDFGLLGIIYIAESEISRLWRKDRRLDRFENYLLEAMDPGSRYGEKYYDGIANICSLFEIAKGHRFDPKTYELLEIFVEEHKEQLKRVRLRRFNMAAIRLCKTLHIFEKNDYWRKIQGIVRKDRSTIGKTAEETLVGLINGVQYHFDAEGERYSAEFLNNRVQMAGWISDGSMRVLREVESEYIPYLNLPIEVKYTTTSIHSDSQIKKVTRMAQSRPTIFFSIGVDHRNLDKLHKKFGDLEYTSQLLVVDIDRDLFNPIFTNTSDTHYNLKHNLQEWFKAISRLNHLLIPFLEELTKRQLLKKIDELQAEIERGRIEAPIITSGSSSSEPMIAGSYEVATIVVTLFEDVSKRKTKKSLPNHVLRALKTPIDNFNQVLDDILNKMVAQKYLDEQPKNYAKTETWSRKALIEFCSRLKR